MAPEQSGSGSFYIYSPAHAITTFIQINLKAINNKNTVHVNVHGTKQPQTDPETQIKNSAQSCPVSLPVQTFKMSQNQQLNHATII